MSCALQGFHFIKNIRCIRVKPVLTILCGSVWPIIKRKSNFFLIFRSAARRTSACIGFSVGSFLLQPIAVSDSATASDAATHLLHFFLITLPPDLSFPFSIIIINHQTLLLWKYYSTDFLRSQSKKSVISIVFSELFSRFFPVIFSHKSYIFVLNFLGISLIIDKLKYK